MSLDHCGTNVVYVDADAERRANVQTIQKRIHLIFAQKVCLFVFVCVFTSVAKSQSGDGVRRFLPFEELASFTIGDELGSSGITANLPR